MLVYVQYNMHMTDERSCRWAPLGWTPNAWLRFPTAPSTSARNGRGDLAPAGSCMRPPRVEVGSLPAAMWQDMASEGQPQGTILIHIDILINYGKGNPIV